MVAVYKVSIQNQFQTGIFLGFDKTSSQNELKSLTTPNFTGDFLYVDYGKEVCNKPGTAFTRTKIHNYSSTKPGVGLVLCAWGFDSIKANFEIEITRNDNLIVIFTSYTICK